MRSCERHSSRASLARAAAAGQGVNQAFEDAVHLAHAIQQGGPSSASLRAYEAKRIPRVRQVMAAEMVGLVCKSPFVTLLPSALQQTGDYEAQEHVCLMASFSWQTPCLRAGIAMPKALHVFTTFAKLECVLA